MFYVYEIRNIVNNKVYIGQTNNPRTRWASHKLRLKQNRSSNPPMQKDFNTFGIQNFKFKVLEECCTRERALEIETNYIHQFGGIECLSVYNCQDNITQNSLMIQHQNEKKIGSKRSKEFKEKQRQFALSDGNGWRGKHHSVETKSKLSKSHTGSKNAMYGLKGSQHPGYGQKRTEEQKEISRLANLGKRKYSKEFIEILREDYRRLGSYNAVSRLRGVNAISISNLLKYGTPAKPKNYK